MIIGAIDGGTPNAGVVISGNGGNVVGDARVGDPGFASSTTDGVAAEKGVMGMGEK